MRTIRTVAASLLTLSLLVPAASTAATSGASAALDSAAPDYAGTWKAKTLPTAKRRHGAAFRFRVNQNNRVAWVRGSYALNNRPSCSEWGFSFEMEKLRVPIDADGTFKVRRRAGLNHIFVVRGRMLSETRARGRLRILEDPTASGYGCGGDYGFAWRGHKL